MIAFSIKQYSDLLVNTLDQLRNEYPGRVTLSAEEVALVLRHSSSRGVVQKVRERMKSGAYPDARKVDGRWHMPFEVVAGILDPSLAEPTVLSRDKKGSRRRSAVGPRIRFVRDGHFWAEVLRLAAMEEDGLGLDLREAEQELHDAYWMGRSEREKAILLKSLTS